jgi:hypothetical protein
MRPTAGVKIKLEYDLHSGQFLNMDVGVVDNCTHRLNTSTKKIKRLLLTDNWLLFGY